MLDVLTPDEVFELIETEFTALDKKESVSLKEAIGRVLSEDVSASEYVPAFNRSTVDGYALRASDTFGCSDSIPAVLPLFGEVLMGRGANFDLPPGVCCAVPTGGAVPEGADCAVMIEYTEDYGDGTVGILKPGAPGMNMIYRGDDVFPGKVILRKGRVLSSQDIGALAAIGKVDVLVSARPVAGVISTGDELVSPETVPGPGQIRDVNSLMLEAMLTAYGCEVKNFGIVSDNEKLLDEKVSEALAVCDMIILSGGSSVGVKDSACRIIQSKGRLLMHGIAMKPGKPTILGCSEGKPVIGLPGHPVAAYFVSKLFVLRIAAKLMGRICSEYAVKAELTQSVSANHGRAQYGCVRLSRDGDRILAEPVRTKSGTITQLAGADGFFCIPRDCEGMSEGEKIEVTVCMGD